MKIVVIKYIAGNIKSVEFALNRLGIEPSITDNPEQISSADKVIFPGVGEAGSTMCYLREKKLDVLIKNLKQPVLGICLGMQLMCTSSEEGKTSCLGIFDTRVKRFSDTQLKIPHMGWNNVFSLQSKLFSNISENDYMYFVHSYYAEMCDYAIASCEYSLPFAAALHKDNFYGTQFHPEKSGKNGEIIIKNFLDL